jgi:cell division protein FtsW
MGFLNSRQKQFYLPEPQTDFIFSVYSSTFGFIGSIFLITLICIFDLTILKISLNKDYKEKYILIGFLGMIVFQQIQNIGMNIGLLPITGITLPFISYGGSSLIITMISMGIILNISRNSE